MKTFLLALWFFWQGITAPFYPDPAIEVAKSSTYLKARLVIGAKLTPEMIASLHSAGFQVRELNPAAEQTFRRNKPWSELPKTRLFGCSKSIQGRPAFSVTDVHAFLAIGADNVILHSEVVVNRTNL